MSVPNLKWFEVNYVVDDNHYEKSLQKFVIMAVVLCVQKK